jgi:hypothetical protein
LSEAATMTIELQVGKSYRTRDGGATVKIQWKSDDEQSCPMYGKLGDEYENWRVDGRYNPKEPMGGLDLVEEVAEPISGDGWIPHPGGSGEYRVHGDTVEFRGVPPLSVNDVLRAELPLHDPRPMTATETLGGPVDVTHEYVGNGTTTVFGVPAVFVVEIIEGCSHEVQLMAALEQVAQHFAGSQFNAVDRLALQRATRWLARKYGSAA